MHFSECIPIIKQGWLYKDLSSTSFNPTPILKYRIIIISIKRVNKLTFRHINQNFMVSKFSSRTQTQSVYLRITYFLDYNKLTT